MQGRAVLGLQSPRAVIRSAHQQDRDRTLHALRRKNQDMQLLPVAHRDHLLAQLEVVVDVGKPGRRDHGLVSLICWGRDRCDMRSASWTPITLSPVVT